MVSSIFIIVIAFINWLQIFGMDEIDRRPHVATSFLLHRGKVLLFRRSSKVGTYKGKWSAVSGYVESHEKPYETALKEVFQETGIMSKDLRLLAQHEVEASDAELRMTWKIHAFLFDCATGKVRPNWESAEFKWVRPEDAGKLDTVPKLKEALAALMEKSTQKQSFSGGEIRPI